MKVAFIGLGRMGSAIAGNIIGKGLDTTVWNRTPSKAEPMIRLGAKTAPTARDAVKDAEMVVTSLMDDQSILDLLHAKDGILAGMAKGATHLCVTTISPELADRLFAIHKQHGTNYVSGPVAGRPAQASAGTLKSYLSGTSESLPAAKKIAETYCDYVRIVDGPASAANTIKLCLNYSAISIIEMIGEVYTFAQKCEVDPQVICDFYQAAFAHPAMREYATTILARDFRSNVGFTLAGGQKDVRLMLDQAAKHGAELDIGKIIDGKMTKYVEMGHQDEDWMAFTEVTRLRAGT